MKQIHVIVSGRVQGVGFRNFTQTVAVENNITGWVSNRDDGAVELSAQGEEKQLESFMKKIKKGPHFIAKVKNIEQTEETVNPAYKKFEIKY